MNPRSLPAQAVLTVSLALVAATTLVADGPTASPAPPPETAKLGALVGRWTTAGDLLAPKGGASTHVTSDLDCGWSADRHFLLCNQTVRLPDGPSHEVSIYSWDAEGKTYRFTAVPEGGGEPRTGSVEIAGNVWTYPGEFENAGHKTRVRTTNEFASPDLMKWKTETSSDGAAWRTTAQGEDHRVAPH